MRTMTTSNLPQNCWIFDKRRYIFKGVLSGLPYIDLEYEAILKSNGIPYRKTLKVSDSILFSDSKEVYEYWNPEVFEEKKLTLPLFAKMPNGSYKYCEKNYSEKVPTVETIEAAQKTKKFVEQQIENYEEILHEVQRYKFAKEKLADKDAVVCISYTTPFDDPPFTSIYEINMNHENFKILRVPGSNYISGWIAIFNMNKVVPNGCITLQVPTHIAGFVIGKGGSNIKAWAREIGVKKIQVVPI